MQSVTHTTSPVYLGGETPFRYFAFLSKSHLPPESQFLHSIKVIAAPVVLSALTFLLQEAVLKLLYFFSCLCFLALLPPVNRIRPRNPPPPPPTVSAEAKSPKSLQSTSKGIEQLEKSKEVKKAVKPTPFYENAEFHNKQQAASSISATPQQQTLPRKTGTVNVPISTENITQIKNSHMLFHMAE